LQNSFSRQYRPFDATCVKIIDFSGQSEVATGSYYHTDMEKKKTLILGAHTSAAGGAKNALYEGQSIGATTIQLFTANQKRWEGKPLEKEDVSAWEKALDETKLSHIMSHDSYLINLGSNDPEILRKSRKTFAEELERCHQLKLAYLNFHPGAAVKSTPSECLDRIVESLLLIQEEASKGPTRLLVETTAGQGSSVGHTFEHIASIVHRIEKKIAVGVCIDTCHIFVAGYDIRTERGWEKTLKEFDEIIGLKHLYAFHLNDSVKELGSRVDRHASLGTGKIGWGCFRFLVTHPMTREKAMYLETPEGPPKWKEEIANLRNMS
jgi:deoxyribonuclease-4